MQAANLLSILFLLVVLETSQSASEWKKYENGKVESETKRSFKSTRNHTLDTNGRRQHILHSHHGDKMSKTREEAEDGMSGNMATWDPPHKNRERHHKTEKNLYRKEAARKMTEAAIPNDDEDVAVTKTKKKRSKPEDMSSIAWRRSQKEAEKKQVMKLKSVKLDNRSDPTKFLRISKLKTGTQKKKMVIAKMDGNQKAKQAWKEAFRGEDKITKSKN